MCLHIQEGIMFPATAKLYMAPISDSNFYDERFFLFLYQFSDQCTL